MWRFLLSVVVAHLLCAATHAFKCPPRAEVAPCGCFAWDDASAASEVEVLCELGLTSQDELRGVFARIAAFAARNNDLLQFDSLRLTNTRLSELSDNVFAGATFRTVDLYGNANLTHLRPSAFTDS